MVPPIPNSGAAFGFDFRDRDFAATHLGSCKGPQQTGPNPLPREQTRRMSGFRSPSCTDIAFLPGCFCQQSSEALPEAGGYLPARKPWGGDSIVTHGPPMAGRTPCPGALSSQGCLAAPGLPRDTEEGQAPLSAGGTLQSRGPRWLPRVFVLVLLAQRSKETQENIRKKHPASSSLELQTSLTYKCL